MTGPEVLVATRSEGKVRELLPMLESAGLRGVTLRDAGISYTAEEEEIEAFDTFEENALAKARWFRAHAAGMPVLADDSGLSVRALGDAPGVRSKRWAAEPGLDGAALDAANNAKLVRALAGARDRSAKYVCVAAIAWAGVNPGELVARGECAGRILETPEGSGGFGYDPFFHSEELGMSFGAASIEAKKHISHRGRAVRAALASFVAAGASTEKLR